MIVFSVICAVLTLVALALILPPLRHPDRLTAASTIAEANRAVFRRQLSEMESDLRHQIVTNEQFLIDRGELEQRVIAELPKESRAIRKERPAVGSAMLIYGLAVGLPLTALLLYLTLGTPSLLQSP